jgi:GGDEF domain-containing protein
MAVKPGRPTETEARPQTRNELQLWVKTHLALAEQEEIALSAAVDAVLDRHEYLWAQSKQEAIQALTAGFAEQIARLKRELDARDSTVTSISAYFEKLVADLTDRSNRDPKTKLINFQRFLDQLETFLAGEQRVRWSAVGLVDITGFKWYNDALGHAVGDRIIERVAQLLREQARAEDIVAPSTRRDTGPARSGSSTHSTHSTRPSETERRSQPSARTGQDPTHGELHARFGGDEFCFLVPDIASCRQAHVIAERFRSAVERYDWTREDPRLAVQPVRVDVGVVCLRLGPIAERRPNARRLAEALVARADTLMYEAKGERADHVYLVKARVENGALVDGSDDKPTSND